MLSIAHQFYAMASDCAVHLCGETAEKVEQFAAAAESEVRRIEMRYSRYRDDSELIRINKVAATGGSVGIDAETAGLIAYAKACFTKSGGAFDITSGLLRKVWDFSASRLPDQGSIDAVLPFIGFDRGTLSNGNSTSTNPAWSSILAASAKNTRLTARPKSVPTLAHGTASSISAVISALSVRNPTVCVPKTQTRT